MHDVTLTKKNYIHKVAMLSLFTSLVLVQYVWFDVLSIFSLFDINANSEMTQRTQQDT